MLAIAKKVAAKAPRAMKSASLTDLFFSTGASAPLMFPGLRMLGGSIPVETRLKGTST
jgi:hypothetical protein